VAESLDIFGRQFQRPRLVIFKPSSSLATERNSYTGKGGSQRD